MNANPMSEAPNAIPSDAALLHGFIAHHDQAAFTELVQRHGPLVLRACRRILGGASDAEDVFQATFVVLARKAASITPPEMVGSWLYGVACRLALKTRGQAQRRQVRERSRFDALLAQRPAGAESGPDEVRPILDEELNRLSETYRLPLVLCYLEGKSHTEVAQQLGCQEPALRQRLMRGRDLLRERLARRGLGASMVVLTTILTQEGATAAVLPCLAVSSGALTGATPAALSPQVAALVDSVAPVAVAGKRVRRCVISVALLLAGLSTWWVLRPAAPLHVIWRFNKGPASDLRVERGQWLHRVDGPGVMEGNDVVVVLPTELPRRPFAVTIKWKPLPEVLRGKWKSRVMPVWTDGSRALPRQAWAGLWKDDWSGQAIVQSQAVFKDRWSALYVNGNLTSIHEYNRPFPARRVLLMLQNSAVEEIELRELAADEIPAELLDVQRTKQTLVPGLTNDI